MYIHFTSREDADAIVESGVLWSDKWHKEDAVGKVYACDVDRNKFSRDTQLHNTGRTVGPRMCAVLFTTDMTPSVTNEVEVVFSCDELVLTDAVVVPGPWGFVALKENGIA